MILIAEKLIEPVLRVHPPVNRTNEYAGSQMTAFSQFMVSESSLRDSRYRTKRAESRAVLGAPTATSRSGSATTIRKRSEHRRVLEHMSTPFTGLFRTDEGPWCCTWTLT